MEPDGDLNAAAAVAAREQEQEHEEEQRIANETDPLLPDGASEQAEYRSISRQTNAEHLPPDDADLEFSKIDSRGNSSSDGKGVYATLSVLLLGVFLSNADQSLVLATYGKVASQFHQLDSGSWLISAFIIASCVAQPLYGSMAGIYGRKACLQTSYILFTLGTLCTGLGQSMSQVIAARAIQGIGSTGMTSLVSIIITDLVPIHEVASLRSYVNVLQTTGRGFGAAIGGILAEALGWRWAFLIQVPLALIAIALIQWRLHIRSKHTLIGTKWEKLKRIDFAGAFFLSATIFCACFILDTGGQKFPWNCALIISMAVVCGLTLLGFIASTRMAAEPIFPLRVLSRYPVWTNYLIAMLQAVVQYSLMMTASLYFQAAARASIAVAGAYLVPAFAGNLMGGVMSGYFIKKTGLYKVPTVLAPLTSLLALALCFTLWNGNATAVKSLATLPSGLAMGLAASSTFVGIAAGVDEKDIAVAGSGLYLFINIGTIAAASASSAVYQVSLQNGLRTALQGVKDGEEIIKRTLRDISYVQNASDEIRHLIVPVFVDSFHSVNLMEAVCAILGLILALLSQQKRLER